MNVNLESIIAEVDISVSEGKQKPDLKPLYFSRDAGSSQVIKWIKDKDKK